MYSSSSRPGRDEFVRQIEDLLEIAVPGGEPMLGVEHRNAVAHVVEGDAQFGLVLADLVEEAGVVHRDHRLRRKVFEQRDLFFRKCPHLAARAGDHAEQRVVAAQRHA